jgi:hypothetical protein
MHKLKLPFITAVLATLSGVVSAQETEWEPQKQITGYVSADAEYIPNLKYTQRNYGVSMPEAGLLASYKPVEKLNLKAVLVYKPNYGIDQMLNELSAEWQLVNNNSNVLNVKVGRFLTPLSPINTNYYAPVNLGITLPLTIAHHELYPMSVNGVSLNGKTGENFVVDYDFFGGGHFNAVFLTSGPLNFFGSEDVYFTKLDNITYNVSDDQINKQLGFGGGGHVGFTYNDMIQFGVNYYTHAKSDIMVYGDTAQIKRQSYGLNFKFKYAGLQFSTEHYWCNVDLTHVPVVGSASSVNYGGFYELSYNINKLTPYIKMDQHDLDMAHINYYRYTAGLNYKPTFETTLKLEYVHYDYEHKVYDFNHSLDGFLASVIYSF